MSRTTAQAHAAPDAWLDPDIPPPDMVLVQARTVVAALGVDWLAERCNVNRKHIEACIARGLAPRVPHNVLERAFVLVRYRQLALNDDDLDEIDAITQAGA